MANIPQQAANIILHIILISTFIGIFFFLYAGKQIEPKVITIQVDRVIGEMTDDIKLVLSDEEKAVIKNVFSSISPPDMSEDDKEAEETNKKLLKKATVFLAFTLCVGLLIVLALVFYYKLNFKEMIMENFVILLCVAATEFAFLSFIAKNYRSLDPNTIKLGLINSLDNYSKS